MDRLFVTRDEAERIRMVRDLLDAVPIPSPEREAQRPHRVIPGEVPSAPNPPPGRPFHPRCPYALPQCRTDPPALSARPDGRLVACHL